MSGSNDKSWFELFKEANEKRFLEKVSQEPTASGCLLWTGAVQRNGYGVFTKNDGSRFITDRSHRVAWELANGLPVPDGMCVMHSCDIRQCVNPSHLFLGTPKDNSRDMVNKGRSCRGDRHWSKTKKDSICNGEKNGMARISRAVVIEIRRIAAAGEMSNKEIAVAFGISARHVRQIISGVRWASVK